MSMSAIWVVGPFVGLLSGVGALLHDGDLEQFEALAQEYGIPYEVSGERVKPLME